jgi:hypothetical protein
MPTVPPGAPGKAAVLLVSAFLAGCTSIGLGEPSAPSAATSSGSSSFMNIFKYGGTTVPASATPEEEEIDCPPVDVWNGMAAMRQEAGGSVRDQLSLGQTARECKRVNGQVVVKVGAEVRALLGPAGRPGTFPVPLRFVVKRGDKVVASRLQRASVTIPANDTQATIVMIEDNLPTEGTGDMEIQVGFDPSGRGAETAPRKRRR